MGHDSEQPGQCAIEAGGARIGDGSSARGGGDVSRCPAGVRRATGQLPLQWAMTHNNLGNALLRLGERESGTAHSGRGSGGVSRCPTGVHARAGAAGLGRDPEQSGQCAVEVWGNANRGQRVWEDAVAAFRAALLQYASERVPLNWAMTQNNLGLAVEAGGTRVGDSASGESVAAFRAALLEGTSASGRRWTGPRHGNNLGNALSSLGERESGTARLGRGGRGVPRRARGTDACSGRCSSGR